MINKFIYTFLAIIGMVCSLFFDTDLNWQNYIKIDKETVALEKYIDTSVSEIIDKYPKLDDYLVNANIKIPIEDNMIPQGITVYKNNILITSYDGSKRYNSLVYVLDSKGNIINKVDLNTKSHVGGIVYDENNNLVWIPDNNGVLNAYNSEEFLTKQKVNPVYIFNNISEGLTDFQNKNKYLIAFLTLKDNRIFVGNFSITEDIIVKEFDIINNNGNIDLKYIRKFNVPAKTQGMIFVKRNNKEYLILSNSYRRRSKSHIYIFEYDENNALYSIENAKKFSLPPLLEQITIKDDRIYTLFESGAKKYSNAIDKIEFICELDVDKMLK